VEGMCDCETEREAGIVVYGRGGMRENDVTRVI